MQTPDWVALRPTQEQIDEAKRMRAARDRRYRNVFQARATDERWVGELGEILLHQWLTQHQIRSQWIVEDAAGRPDLVLSSGVRLGVKTVKRQGPPKAHYTAQITKRHAHEPVDHFVFLSYDICHNVMYVLGSIDAQEFLRQARYYGPGEQVHANYTIRSGHEIYNIEINKLRSPSSLVEGAGSLNTKPTAAVCSPSNI